MLRFGGFIWGVALIFSGCASSGRIPHWERTQSEARIEGTTSATVAMASVHQAAKVAWRERDERAQLAEAIQAWEKIVASSPGHAPTLLALARAQFFLGQAFLSLETDGDPKAEAQAYELGTTYAERALEALAPEFVEALKRGVPKPFEKLSVKGAPAAYWYAVNLGHFAALKGERSQEFHDARLRKTMRAVLRLVPDMHHGGADRYLGAHHAGLSTLGARDLAASEEHFSAARARAPQFLLNRLDHAKFLAVERADETLFKSILQEVLAAPDTGDPDIAPENRVAKKQARLMLGLVDQVF